MPIKVTYILSEIDKAQAFEWITDNLNKKKFKLSFILLSQKEGYLQKWLIQNNIETYHIKHNGKKSYFLSFLKTIAILIKIKPNIVHTHLIDANIIGLLAAKFCFVKKRIYTRHHSTLHHQYFPKAVKYDKFLNKIATDIVAISINVKRTLIEREKVNPEKITLIYHGFDLEAFNNISKDSVEILKLKYNIQKDKSPVLGVISRYVNWKGIQYIIPAFKKVLKDYPNAFLILANANGPFKHEIQKLLKENISQENFIEIKFENDLFALYQLFDIYIHVPIDDEIEAFGQTYIEALAAGVPSIFTLSGIASEFIKDKKNAVVVDFKNSNAIYEAVIKLLSEPSLINQLKQNGKEAVLNYNLNGFIKSLEELYTKSSVKQLN